MSADEHLRAARFLDPDAKRRFVVARAHLRAILAEVTGSSRSGLVFAYGRLGKPFLPATPDVQFSLSRSGEEAVVAVDPGAPVGIDLEVVRPRVLDVASAALVLSEDERTFIQRSRDPDRAALACWVRKEAYAKLTGCGLERGLAGRTLTTVTGAIAPTAGYELTDIDDGPGVVLALARATGELSSRGGRVPRRLGSQRHRGPSPGEPDAAGIWTEMDRGIGHDVEE